MTCYTDTLLQSVTTAVKAVFPVAALCVQRPLYLFVPMASISSMKTMEGACSSATRNSSRTSFGPSPRYFWISSEPTTRRKVADVWLATALASKVLPGFSWKEILSLVCREGKEKEKYTPTEQLYEICDRLGNALNTNQVWIILLVLSQHWCSWAVKYLCQVGHTEWLLWEALYPSLHNIQGGWEEAPQTPEAQETQTCFYKIEWCPTKICRDLQWKQ